METQTLTKFKWFWAWDDEKEEAWLGEMSRQGWHLNKAEVFGRYTFIQGPEQEYIYRLDFQSGVQQDRQEYLQLFADAGWEHVGVLGGWQYFRKAIRAGETAEIFTDNQSKIAKYQRVMTILAVLLPIYLIILRSDFPARYGDVFIFIVKSLQICILGLYIFALLKLLQRIRQLRKQ